MTNTVVDIEYIRPGKETAHYVEGLVVGNHEYLKTFTRLPEDVVQRLTTSLRDQGFIGHDQRCGCVTKIYYFHENFNLLLFQDELETVLGYYSDVGTPLIKTAAGYQMTDWFLDIWLSPDGRLFELDLDEFEDALSRNLLSESEAEIARRTFARLIDEVRRGVYPDAYMR